MSSKTYYVVKETKEVIGKHKDWLKLRDENPTKFKELNNTRKVDLIRIGYFNPDRQEKIKEYGLWGEHVKICKEYMQRELQDVQNKITTIKSDLELPLSLLGKGYLRGYLDLLEQTEEDYINDIRNPAVLKLTEYFNY